MVFYAKDHSAVMEAALHKVEGEELIYFVLREVSKEREQHESTYLDNGYLSIYIIA